MTTTVRRFAGLLLALACATLLHRVQRGHGREGAQPSPIAAPAIRFEPNQGQLAGDVRFAARGPGYGLYLSRGGATLALGRPGAPPASVTMRLRGAAAVDPIGEGPLPGASHYLVGDRSRWRTGVPGYAGVRYAGVRPGVDLVYYGTAQRELEYDLVLAPGADPAALRMTFEGIARATVSPDGAAVLALAGGGELRKAPPRAYQERAGQRVAVLARYDVGSDGSLGFTVGAYDRARPLVIDPELLFSTYLGGSNSDGATALARDASGALYLAGYTLSTNFPTAAAPAQAANGGSYDVFLTKFFPGSPLVWSTYLGGGGEDRATGIAVDGAGNVYVSGFTYSTNFPTAAPFQAASGGAPDAFVAKLNASGSALVYATYLGGTGTDAAYGLAVDSGGAAYVAGTTASAAFPTAAAIQPSLRGSSDSFVTKLNAAGSALVYSTFLGGSSDEVANGIAVDPVGSAYVTGWTASTNFPTVSPVQASLSGSSDVFVARLDTAGSALSYATYLGGSGIDIGNAIAVDASFNAYVGGYTNSTNFPVLAAAQPAFGGNFDGFVTKLGSSGSALAYSTYLGGAFFDRVNAISVSNGEASVAGITESVNFPTASPLQPSHGGSLDDAFLTTVSGDGGVFVYSSYLGGSGDDDAHAVASAPQRTAVAGTTRSMNFPVWKSLQGTNRGGPWDAFVTQLGTPAPPVPASSPLYRVALGGLLLALLLLLAPPLPRRR